MKLFLIRHGETVDNVAGLYAGVRDSALTNHGVEQARRLGEYLANSGVNITHIYASPLTRAHKTAEAVRKAQQDQSQLEIVTVPDLIEQDFGFYEGKPFVARSSASPKKSGRDVHHDKHRDDPGFVDVESRESMGRRADAFLDQHLMPRLTSANTPHATAIAVVSHGMLLANLWRKLLLRLPRKSLSIAPEVTAARGAVVLEHLGGWSNTGYLELAITRQANAPRPATLPSPLPACSPTNQPTKLQLTNQSSYLPTNQPNYQLTNHQSSNLLTNQPIKQPTYQPTKLPTYQPTNLPTDQPNYRLTCLPTYLLTNLPTDLPLLGLPGTTIKATTRSSRATRTTKAAARFSR